MNIALTINVSFRREFLAIPFGVGIAALSLLLHSLIPSLISDISIPHCGALALIHGENPYNCHTFGMPSNPMTTILALLPLAWLPIRIASAAFIGMSAGLLAYSLLQDGKLWRLGTFLSFPFLYSLVVTQWAPLLLAAAFLPKLYPVWLLKPHIGWPAAFMRFSWIRGLLSIGIVVLTLIILPSWPWQWLAQTVNFDGFIPVAVFPVGTLLLLALPLWREIPARWLILLSFTPQRLWYDQLLLWVIPQTPGQMLFLTLASWGILIPIRLGLGFHKVGLLLVTYIPCLIIILAPHITLKIKHLASKSFETHKTTKCFSEWSDKLKN